MMTLIDDIDAVLSEHGMKLVFIFDQINRIFARSQFHDTKDVSLLLFPFSMMLDVLKAGRIISLISGSGNNDVSHREKHDGYEVFQYPPQFDDDEIKLLYTTQEMARWNPQELQYATGRVPLYINRWAKDRNTYYLQVRSEIESAVTKLRIESKKRNDQASWESIVKSAINCLLCIPLTELPYLFDRKYSKVEIDPGTNMCSIVALRPLVAEIYRDFLWYYLATDIDRIERCILNVHSNSDRASLPASAIGH